MTIGGSGSGSIPLTCRSRSGRSKNMWIRWIRIRIRNNGSRNSKFTNPDSDPEFSYFTDLSDPDSDSHL
jgi:hypothetical protein